MEKSSELEQMDPWSLYIYAMKAPMTRDRYQTRLAKFLDFIGMIGTTLEERARVFAKRGKDDSNWSLNSILKFVQFQNDRVNNKEISGATVRNYVEMANNINKENNNNIVDNNNNTISIKLIPYIKCQYCNSEFSSEKEKKEHELEWHI